MCCVAYSGIVTQGGGNTGSAGGLGAGEAGRGGLIIYQQMGAAEVKKFRRSIFPSIKKQINVRVKVFKDCSVKYL